MPLICPTCQVFSQSTSLPGTACYFAWGCFRYFWLGAKDGSLATAATRLTAALLSHSSSLVGAHLQCFLLHSVEVLEDGRGFLRIDVVSIECTLLERRHD